MITKPTLFLDEKQCRKNIETMCSKAKKSNVDFRPHFKTHQSQEIGSWFKEFGIDKITVSSLEMARYFAEDWNDITVAFPVNILEIETINSLAQNIELNLLVESRESITALESSLKHRVGAFIKIDTGYHRTGVDPNQIAEIDELARMIAESEMTEFKGFLAHAGHSYKCRSKEEIRVVHKQSTEAIVTLAEHFSNKYSDLTVSIGDTPTCSVADDFSMVDEIRPGNFVFYDLAQHQIGACEINQIAAAMACPIVAIHKARNEIVIYGGGVHFSKECLEEEKHGAVYGQVVEKKETGWGDPTPDMYIKSLSQEHGIIATPESEISKYKVGDCVHVLPVHSCMTANLMKSYKTTDGKTISRL